MARVVKGTHRMPSHDPQTAGQKRQPQSERPRARRYYAMTDRRTSAQPPRPLPAGEPPA